MSKKVYVFHVLLLLVFILAACAAPPASPEPVVETMVVTEVVEATPVEVIQVVTPTPEPAGSRTLVICLGDEPEVLSPYGSGRTNWQILESVYGGIWWGAVDHNSFTYQPIIQEKLPSIPDGDAVVSSVLVSEGDTVSEGQPLCEVETDKATFEVEATASGSVLGIFYPADSDVEVLKPIAAIGEPGEDISALRPATDPGAPSHGTPACAAAPPSARAESRELPVRRPSGDRNKGLVGRRPELRVRGPHAS